jgi:hypothetical protein
MFTLVLARHILMPWPYAGAKWHRAGNAAVAENGEKKNTGPNINQAWRARLIGLVAKVPKETKKKNVMAPAKGQPESPEESSPKVGSPADPGSPTTPRRQDKGVEDGRKPDKRGNNHVEMSFEKNNVGAHEWCCLET